MHMPHPHHSQRSHPSHLQRGHCHHPHQCSHPQGQPMPKTDCAGSWLSSSPNSLWTRSPAKRVGCWLLLMPKAAWFLINLMLILMFQSWDFLTVSFLIVSFSSLFEACLMQNLMSPHLALVISWLNLMPVLMFKSFEVLIFMFPMQ